MEPVLKEPVSLYVLVNQENGKLHRLIMGRNYAGRCPPNMVHVTLRAVVSSRRHAELMVNDDNTVSIFDLGSGNGTYINFNRIPPHVPNSVLVNDMIGFGIGNMAINEFNEGEELPVFRLEIMHPSPSLTATTNIAVDVNISNSDLEELSGEEETTKNKKLKIRKLRDKCEDSSTNQSTCSKIEDPLPLPPVPTFQSIALHNTAATNNIINSRTSANDSAIMPAQSTMHKLQISNVQQQSSIVDNKTNSVYNKTIAVDSKTVSVDSKTICVDNKTILVGGKINDDSKTVTDFNQPVIEPDFTRVKIENEDCIIEIEDDQDEDIILSQAAFSCTAAVRQDQSIAESTYIDIKQELIDIGLTSVRLPIIDLTEEADMLDWMNESGEDIHVDLEAVDPEQPPESNNNCEQSRMNPEIPKNKLNENTRVVEKASAKIDELESDCETEFIQKSALNNKKRRYSRISSDSESESNENNDATYADGLIRKDQNDIEKPSTSNKYTTNSNKSHEQKQKRNKSLQHKQNNTNNDANRKNIHTNLDSKKQKQHEARRKSSEDDFDNSDNKHQRKVESNNKSSAAKKRRPQQLSNDDIVNIESIEQNDKSTNNGPLCKKLKPGSNYVESRMDTKGIQMELVKRQKINKRKTKTTVRPVTNVDMWDKQTRENIVKERKEKLKSLCPATAEEMGKEPDAEKPGTSKEGDTALKATAKVKVSKGRGVFLCETAGNSKVQRAKKYQVPPVVPPHHMGKKVRIAHSPTKITHAGVVSTRTRSCSAQARYPTTSTTRNHPPRPISPSQLRILPIDINTVNPLRHMMPPAPLLLPPSTSIPTSIFIHPAVSCMISWTSRSFNEYHNRRSGLIPGLKDGAAGTLRHTSTLYDSYEQYKNVMEPLITIELWMNVYEDWCKAGSTPDFFRAKVEHVDIRSNYTSILCKTFVSGRDVSKLMFKKTTLLIGSFQIIDPQNSQKRSFMQLVTYIHNIERRSVNRSEEIPPFFTNGRIDCVLYITLLTKTTTASIDTNKLVKCDFVSNVSNTMKLFDAMQYLQHSPLKNILLNPTVEQYDVRKYINYDKPLHTEISLNESQRRAVLEASYACACPEPRVYLLDGPPGTGKTTVITELIKQLLFHKETKEQVRILVVAPSNGAIDNLMLKIIEIKKQLITAERKYAFKVIRVGSPAQIHPFVRRYSIEEYANNSLNHTMIRENRAFKEEHDRLLEQYTSLRKQREVNGNDPELLTAMRTTGYNIEHFARNKLGPNLYRHLSKEKCTIINQCHIICTTLSSCVRLSKNGDLPLNHYINCCIVDEATQSVEQETLIPLILGVDKLILVGDPQQLPAVTCSPVARSYGYGQSLFARIKTRLSEQTLRCPGYNDIVRFLDTQYRMHPHIALFPNHAFYDGRLKDAPSLQLTLHSNPPPINKASSSFYYPSVNKTIPVIVSPFTPFSPISNMSTTPSPTTSPSSLSAALHRPCPISLRTLRPYMVIRQSERDMFPSQQYRNQSEVDLVVGLYFEIGRLVVEQHKIYGEGSITTVGIITPYNKQKEMIEKGVKQLGMGVEQGLHLSITTVDGVQGQEKDVVIISNVRTHGNSFVENENRLNVALTRARHVLYIVGSDNLFEESDLFREIERDAISRKAQATIPNSAYVRDVIRLH